jgi:DNA-binding GntR family transcriptional regulator
LKDADLADRFQVSRNTVRDAVKQLVTAGLATARLNAGSAVRTLSETDARDIYAVRRTLEIAGVQQSSHASQALMDRMRNAVVDQQSAARAQNWGDVGTASLRFHHALSAFNCSSQIDAFFENVLAQLRLTNAVMKVESDFQQLWMTRDAEICELVRRGRRERAVAELRDYLNDSEALIIDTIRATQG